MLQNVFILFFNIAINKFKDFYRDRKARFIFTFNNIAICDLH